MEYIFVRARTRFNPENGSKRSSLPSCSDEFNEKIRWKIHIEFIDKARAHTHIQIQWMRVKFKFPQMDLCTYRTYRNFCISLRISLCQPRPQENMCRSNWKKRYIFAAAKGDNSLLERWWQCSDLVLSCCSCRGIGDSTIDSEMVIWNVQYIGLMKWTDWRSAVKDSHFSTCSCIFTAIFFF